MTVERQSTGALDQRGVVFAGERQDATHPSLADTSLFPEKKFAHLLGLRSDDGSLMKKALRHPGGIEDPVGLHHLDASRVQASDVPSNELKRSVIDLDLKSVDPDDHHTVDRGRQGRVEGAFHLDASVVPDGADPLLEVSERLQGQFLEVGFFFQKHLLDLPLCPSMDAEGRPAFLPAHQPPVLILDGFKLPPLQGRTLGMLDRVLDGPFPVGVGDTRRIGDDAVMGKHGGIDGI